MLGRTVGVLAASALTAQAILLPPGVASVEGDLDFPVAVNTNSQTIKLSCPECVATTQENTESEAKDDTLWIQGGSNDLVLNFTVEDDGHVLGMNGYTLFPPSINFEKPSIRQVASSVSLSDVKESSADAQSVQVSADSIFVSEESVSPAGDAIVRVTYQLLSVDSHPVSVDGAEVTMLKSAEGELMILSVEPAPKAHSIFDALPPTHGHKDDQPSRKCNMPSIMCKVSDMFDDAFDSGVKNSEAGHPKIKGGCHGKKLPGHKKPGFKPFESEDEGRPERHHGRPPKGTRPPHPPHGEHPHGEHPHGPPPHGEHPHGARPHGHHHHGHHGHHRHHHMMHKFFKGLVMVLVPIMAGITMGMTVSLIGMLVGRLVAFLWIKLARGGQRGYATVAQEEREAEEADEKVHEIYVEEEPLPRYEDTPAYEETEKK